jgi:hypothetical protein
VSVGKPTERGRKVVPEYISLEEALTRRGIDPEAVADEATRAVRVEERGGRMLVNSEGRLFLRGNSS